MAIASRRADIHIQRNWSFDERGIVCEQLALAFAGEIPGQAEARCCIVPEVIELNVGATISVISLLEVPANTKVELKVTRELIVVLDVESFCIRKSLCVELEIPHAGRCSYQEGIAKRFGCRY